MHKPVGPTSHDIVDRARRLFDTRRVGHTGTLDPMAQGLLLLCLGKATKVARYFTAMPKTYRATVRLGRQTTTGDAEGEIVASGETTKITRAQIDNTLAHFRGVINQRVPPHSAVKVGGRRLYAYARKGQEVPEIVREIEIFDLAVESFANPDLIMMVRCSGGTYIRALARDIGDALGCGGYLVALTRTKIGEYDNCRAENLDELAQIPSLEERVGRLRPIEEFLPFPVVMVDGDESADVLNGRQFPPGAVKKFSGRFGKGETLLFCDRERQVLALAVAKRDSEDLTDHSGTDWFRYERVLV
ncbi:tRNA pseudouridine(55) synthase TruB [Candidatus Zixiibacteriota bacterium]